MYNMKNITLKEYFEIKGYGKGKKINVSKFADMVDVSISYISKLLNSMPLSHNDRSKCFNKIKDYVAKDGYNLVVGNSFDFAINNVLKNNDRLKEENRLLKLQNELQKQQLENYKSLIKLCNLIVKNDNRLGETTFSIRNSKCSKSRKVVDGYENI